MLRLPLRLIQQCIMIYLHGMDQTNLTNTCTRLYKLHVTKVHTNLPILGDITHVQKMQIDTDKIVILPHMPNLRELIISGDNNITINADLHTLNIDVLSCVPKIPLTVKRLICHNIGDSLFNVVANFLSNTVAITELDLSIDDDYMTTHENDKLPIAHLTSLREIRLDDVVVDGLPNNLVNITVIGGNKFKLGTQPNLRQLTLIDTVFEPLPQSLTHLSLHSPKKLVLDLRYLTSLQSVDLSYVTAKLPQSVTSVELNTAGACNLAQLANLQTLNINNDMYSSQLPASITSLTIREDYINKLSHFTNLRELNLDFYINTSNRLRNINMKLDVFTAPCPIESGLMNARVLKFRKLKFVNLSKYTNCCELHVDTCRVPESCLPPNIEVLRIDESYNVKDLRNFKHLKKVICRRVDNIRTPNGVMIHYIDQL